MKTNNYNMTKKNKKNNWIHVDCLKYDVIGPSGQVLLAAGTKNVSIKFRSGCFQYLNQFGELVRANKYKDSIGRIYYGH